MPASRSGQLPTSGLIMGKFLLPHPQLPVPSVLCTFRVQAAGMLREAAVVAEKGSTGLGVRRPEWDPSLDLPAVGLGLSPLAARVLICTT